MVRSKLALTAAAAVLAAALAAPLRAHAEDAIEAAGVAVGVTAGNAVVIPAKAVSVGWGLISGALSFILTGGNLELTQQIWRDVTEGPYLVTPDVARRAIGERPELEKRKTGMAEAALAPGSTSPVVETNLTP